MSDRTLSKKARESILSALERHLDQTAKIDQSSLPIPPERPAWDKINSTAIRETAQSLGLGLKQPIVFPQILDSKNGVMGVNDSELFYANHSCYNIAINRRGGKTSYFIADRDEELPPYQALLIPQWLSLPLSDQYRVAKYRPLQIFETYDTRIFKSIQHFYLIATGLTTTGDRKNHVVVEIDPEPEEILAVYEEEYSKCHQVCETTFFGINSWQTQLERLKAGKDVCLGLNGFNARKRFTDLYTLQEGLQLLERFLPLPHSDLYVDALVLHPSDYMHAYVEESGEITLFDFIPETKPDAAAGVPWPAEAKKNGLTFSALAVCDVIYTIVDAALKKHEENPRRTTLSDVATEVLETFPYLLQNYLFPKAEKYTTEQLTRNIVSVSLISHLLGSKVTSASCSSTHINCMNHADGIKCPSLYGFSAMRGNMDKFFKSVAALSKEAVYYWVYADNIYVLYHGDWYSLDLTKGESQTSREGASLVANYFLNVWYTSPTHLKITRAWYFIATILLPYIYVDSTVVFGNQRIKFYGQSSGNAWTFFNNHLVSSMIVDKLEKARNPRPGTDNFSRVMKNLGVNIKIELHEVDFLENLKKGLDFPDHADLTTDTTVNTEYAVLRADFLGWDLAFCRFPNNPATQIVPVLAEERFRKTLLFSKPKKISTKNELLEGVFSAAMENLRMQACLAIGGWRHPLWRKAINDRTNASYSAFQLRINKMKEKLPAGIDMKHLLAEVMQDLPFDLKDFLEFTKPVKRLHADRLIPLFQGVAVPVIPQAKVNVPGDFINLTSILYRNPPPEGTNGITDISSWADQIESETSKVVESLKVAPSDVFSLVDKNLKAMTFMPLVLDPLEYDDPKPGADIYAKYKMKTKGSAIESYGTLKAGKPNVSVEALYERAGQPRNTNRAPNTKTQKRSRQRKNLKAQFDAVRRMEDLYSKDPKRRPKMSKIEESQGEENASDLYQYVEF